MGKNKVVLLAGSIIAIGVLIIFLAASPNAADATTISNLLDNSEKYEEKYLQIEGKLIEDSVKWDARNVELQFTIQDDNGTELDIVYNKPKPDSFTDGVVCILKGQLTADNVFQAENLQTKCPSKYEGEDVADHKAEKEK